MVVHALLDVSMYAGTPAGDRYDEAGDDEAMLAALQDMPDATVTFSEAAKGEPFFVEAPEGFFEQFPEPDDADGEPRDFLGSARAL